MLGAALLDEGTPVLCTTATATSKVADDIVELLGGVWNVQRGSLLRQSLSLHNVAMPDKAARLAWLADNVPALPGSGVVYVNSKPDADQIADWLRSRDISARAYYAGVAPSYEVWKKPNSITLAGSKLVRAKFRYTSWFRAGSKQAPNQLRTSSELAPNRFGASCEPASVMEFGFYISRES